MEDFFLFLCLESFLLLVDFLRLTPKIQSEMDKDTFVPSFHIILTRQFTADVNDRLLRQKLENKRAVLKN